jgi:DNA-binding Xre family transcriptional regulator
MSDAEEAQQERPWRDLIQWRVKEMARSRGIPSAIQLSERCGINKNSMTSIWNGSSLRIDRDSLGKLCSTLECTPGDLLVFVGGPNGAERS